MAAAAVLGTTMLAGCGNSSKDEKVPTVSVAQIVEHKSLNEIRDSFKEEMKALGYKDGENIKLEFKDAGNQQNTLNSILSTLLRSLRKSVWDVELTQFCSLHSSH